MLQNQIEVGLNGYNYEDYSSLNLQQQSVYMSAGIAQLQSMLGVTPQLFVPPFDTFDSDTIQAAVTDQFTHFSSSSVLDPPPCNYSQNIWRFPSGASTVDPSVTQYDKNSY